MEPPILRLTVELGPREGETLEFRPGSTVRIGRVVRGNNVTIKDAGISSKHLVIVSESGKWSLQDLNSSNGTTLNSTVLSPYKSFDLRDGDTFKLEELTSILVQINVHEETSQLRRNPRRRVRTCLAVWLRVLFK
jgi:pSer/pThr/pTyr-binding forkhead associated (FHA) protein